MNITQESTGDLTATIQIELKEVDYIDAVNKQLVEYRKKSKYARF